MDVSWFQECKNFLISTFGLSKDALHIYIGLIVFFVTALLIRRPLRSWLPLLMVVLAALVGEVLDMKDDIFQLGGWRWKASLHDLVNTMFWPFVIWLLAYWRLLRTS